MVLRDRDMEPDEYMDEETGNASADLTGIIDTAVGQPKSDFEDESAVEENNSSVVSQFQWNVNRDLGSDPTDNDLSQVEDDETDWEADSENLEVLDDPVRMYLREIGRVHLLTSQDEKDLARKIEGQKHLRKTRLSLGQLTIDTAAPTVSTIKPGVIYDSKFSISGEESWTVTKTLLNKIIMSQPLIDALGEVLEIKDGAKEAANDKILGTIVINSEDLSNQDNLDISSSKDLKEGLIEISPEDEFQLAFDLLRSQKFIKAKNQLRKFIKNNPDNELSGSAHYWLGEIYLLKKEYREAALVFAEGYQKFPKNIKAPEMLFKLSESLVKIDRVEDACNTLINLYKEFPKNKFAIKSKNRSKELNCVSNTE